ncbi:MAG TPA: MBL fold metallo-hydrolase [Gemmataceae bacterium]|jgi:L-ascorbate metabolism protein UlaG (beta-lactamase superfamily)
MRRLLTLFTALVLAAAAPAAGGKQLSIRWLGQSFFLLTTSAGTRIAFDPHAIEQFGRPTVEADLVLISHPHPDHTRIDSITNKGKFKVIEGIKVTPPAAEGGPPRTTWNHVEETFKDVKVRTVPTYHDTVQGMSRGKNTVFVLEADGLHIVFLGDLGHVLTDDQVRQIGPVDILFVPIGGVYTLNGSKAKEVVAQLKPTRYVIPMHYGVRVFEDLLPPDEFLDGQKNVQRMLKTNELKVSTDVVPPAPVTVLLGWEASKK